MAGFNVKVEFDAAGVRARVENAAKKGLAVMSNEALKDANVFAREDTGELIRSSLRSSEPEKGRLIWNTPYAKRMYYTGTPVKDINPQAELQWAHKGYALNRQKYLRMLDKITKQEV